MKYLVTGGAGFIGSNLVEQLLLKGHEVRVIDNFSTGNATNLAKFTDVIELIRGDIRDYWTVVRAVKGVDYILHQAALASVPRSVDNPLSSNEANINGTLHLLEAARHAGVKKMVMASSSSIYGESEELPKHEGMTPHPLSPYAVSKITDEYYCRVYWELYQFPTLCLRYFNVFGPRQDPNGDYAAVIPKFITAFLTGQQPTVFGDGEHSRDFTYIDNTVQANLLGIECDELVGTAYNAACGDRYTLNQLLDKLREIIGVDTPARYEDPRAGDIKHSYAAIERIQKFGYKPTIGFEEGLQKTVEYFRSLQGK